MGADVTLVLKADSTQYVKSINDATKATQKLHDTATQGEKREKGILQEIDDTLQRLQKARQKAFSYEDIAKYNKKIEETKQNLQEYERAGLEATKKTESLTQSIGKWALSLGGAAAIIGALKEAIMKLTPAIDAVKIASAAYNQVLNNIVTNQTSWLKGVYEAIKIQEKFNALRKEQYKEGFEVQKLETEFQRKWSESLNAELTTKEKIIKIDEALAAHNKAIDIQMEHAIKTRNANAELLLNEQGVEENYKNYYESLKEIEKLDAERYSSTKRLTRQRSTLEKEEHDNRLKLWNDEIEAQNKINEDRWKQEEAYQQKVKELIDSYEKSNIESLTGKKKLEAQRDFGVKQIKELRDQLAKLGPITQEQYAMLQDMANNVWQAYYKALAEGAAKGEFKISQKDKDIISKALLGGMADLEGLQKSTITDLQKRQVDAAGKKGEPLSVWSLIGIDPGSDDGKKAMDALIKAKDLTIEIIDEVYQKRVDDATRRRELLDTQIDETQQELESEIDLYQSGYASNVALKKKQLADLKKQRAIALKEEEEAIKRQRQFDTLTQISALITSSANIYKSLSPLGPAGLIIAIATISAMFAAFTATKVRAAAVTKLGEGGSGSDRGMVTGKSHASGGEKFLSQVEVERGEAWGVLSVPASQKFGKVFHHMVSSFNKGEIPSIVPINRISNAVSVENSGPNSRLDQVIMEQRRLNAKLMGDSVQEIGNMKVIRKGSTTRVISR